MNLTLLEREVLTLLARDTNPYKVIRHKPARVVSQAILRLERKGLVREGTEDPTPQGREAVDVTITRDLLALVGVDVPLEALETRTVEEVVAAEEWAGREHLRASDNMVRRRPMPGWLRDWTASKPQNVCEHGDHPAPPCKRFCSEACKACEIADGDVFGCANLCGREPRHPDAATAAHAVGEEKSR